MTPSWCIPSWYVTRQEPGDRCASEREESRWRMTSLRTRPVLLTGRARRLGGDVRRLHYGHRQGLALCRHRGHRTLFGLGEGVRRVLMSTPALPILIVAGIAIMSQPLRQRHAIAIVRKLPAARLPAEEGKEQRATLHVRCGDAKRRRGFEMREARLRDDDEQRAETALTSAAGRSGDERAMNWPRRNVSEEMGG